MKFDDSTIPPAGSAGLMIITAPTGEWLTVDRNWRRARVAFVGNCVLGALYRRIFGAACQRYMLSRSLASGSRWRLSTGSAMAAGPWEADDFNCVCFEPPATAVARTSCPWGAAQVSLRLLLAVAVGEGGCGGRTDLRSALESRGRRQTHVPRSYKTPESSWRSEANYGMNGAYGPRRVKKRTTLPCYLARSRLFASERQTRPIR